MLSRHNTLEKTQLNSHQSFPKGWWTFCRLGNAVCASLFTSKTTEDVTINTTFDPKIQQAAEDVLENIFREKVDPKSKAQAAIVIMSPSGAVRAMVGGRKLHVAGTFNRSTQALRQPGSAFKPLVYATALEQGYKPNDLIRTKLLRSKYKAQAPGHPKITKKNLMALFL